MCAGLSSLHTTVHIPKESSPNRLASLLKNHIKNFMEALMRWIQGVGITRCGRRFCKSSVSGNLPSG